MRRQIGTALLAGIIALSLPGCQAYQQQSGTTKGAVLGTVGGAAIGSAIGAIADGGEGAWKGAAIGAAIGGVGGGLLGNYMDKQAREMQAVLSEQDRIRREQETIYISLGSDVLFDSGSAAVQPGARNKLLEVGGILSKYPRTLVTITGHTDSRGAEEMNYELSLRRARAVAEQLTADGVSSARISTRGDGESRPVANNETREGRQLNRRVELVIKPDSGLRAEHAAQGGSGSEPK